MRSGTHVEFSNLTRYLDIIFVAHYQRVFRTFLVLVFLREIISQDYFILYKYTVFHIKSQDMFFVGIRNITLL